jgi:hypothetical protein
MELFTLENIPGILAIGINGPLPFASLVQAETFARAWTANEDCTNSARPYALINLLRRPSDGMVHVVTA